MSTASRRDRSYDLVKNMDAGGISKSQACRFSAKIDERVNAFPTQPLEATLRNLWLDVTYLKVRKGWRMISRARIIALAVNQEGKREVLGVANGFTEVERSWSGLSAVAG